MKQLLLAFILLTPVMKGQAQSKAKLLKDTIVWSADDRLVKEDFKAKPGRGETTYGMTGSGLLLSTKSETGKLKFNIQAVFFRSRSWLKTDSEYGLKHEQGHFDLCEIFARKLRKELASRKFVMSKKLNAEIHNIYQRVMDDLNKEQERYDRETQHSIIKEKQEEWNKKIAEDLENLKEYSGADVEAGLK